MAKGPQDVFEDGPDDAVKMLPESTYLGAWDLNGKEVTLKIRQSGFMRMQKRGDMAANRTRILYFATADGKPCKKGLLCGAKNWKAMIKMFGRIRSKWIDKAVTLYPAKDRGKGGKIVDCVRIKIVLNPEDLVVSEQEPHQPMDQEMRRNQMEQAGELPIEDDDNEDEALNEAINGTPVAGEE